MTISLILDVVVVALLVPTIVFAVILNSRLSALRKNREELGRLIAAFNEATLRAESGIPRLRKASEEASKALQERVERAQLLRDDLAFMVERAGQAADRLEGAVRTARDNGPVSTGAAPSVATVPPAASAGRAVTPPAFMDVESAAAAAERVAMEAVAAATKAAAAEVPLTAAPDMRPRPSAMSGAAPSAASRPAAPPRPVATRPAAPAPARPATAAPVAPRPSRPASAALGASSLGAALASETPSAGASPSKQGFGDDERSEAERELLRALQSAR
ncbi:DUF6468 domain-containing protein [Novispirillum itersonii]|uniref:DUF6468 domain-containing protein n=1 Tax=Novispirillum itersonii TaxID=189 RepID=A0A7X0DMK7_NOVIT|nr:DUF6468 domain-containing protein [Novispirillum itersonii]MBB6209282.1 hypothetical protein [Novispirillum itersonii]